MAFDHALRNIHGEKADMIPFNKWLPAANIRPLRFVALIALALWVPVSTMGQETSHTPAGRTAGATSTHPAKITIADDHSYAPFSFIDAQGQPAGITIDIWSLWSRKTGIPVEFTLMEWDAALAAVRNGKADAVGGLFRTPEREVQFDFSHPFFTIETSIFFHTQIHGIRGLADLEGFIIGVVKGDSAEEHIRQEYPKASLAVFPGTEELVQAAVAGKITVFVADDEVGRFYLAKLDQANSFHKASTPVAVNRQYTAVGKGNSELLAHIQAGLDRIDEKEINAIVDAWTGRKLLSSIPWLTICLVVICVTLLAGVVLIWNVMLKRKVTTALEVVEQRNRQLKASESQFKALFDLAPFACVVSDLQGSFLMVNQAFCRFNQLKESDAIGHTMKDLGFSVDQHDAETSIRELEQFGSVTNKETTIVSPRGERHVSLYSSRVTEVQGKQVILSATVDITPLRQAEQELRASEYRFRTFFNSNPEGIALMDFHGKILDINKNFARIVGYEPDEIRNRQFTDLLVDSYQSKAMQTFNAIRAGISRDVTDEMTLIRKDGTQLPITANGWRVTDEKSNPVMIGVFVHDLTREKKLAQEKMELQTQLAHSQKLDAIGTLAGGIAHDFNNILVGIIGYTELALKAEAHTPNSPKNAYLNGVLEAGLRAKELVRQILKFSRREKAVMGSVSMTPLIKEAVKLLRATLPATIRIEQRISANRDTIDGDPTQIHQVVMNLCTNAYHGMREKGGLLIINLENVTLQNPRKALSLEIPPGDYVKLIVEDTGCGISAQVMARIFEPYFTTKDKNEGTGLGLSVTLGIVRSHSGLIEVESSPGMGTKFAVHLPLAREAETKNLLPSGDLPRGNNQRVLVVDDEFFFLDVVRENLEHLGYQVTSCQSSLQAIEILTQAPDQVELLITDQTMPDLTGVQLIAEIRKVGVTLPVLLCTGYSETVTEQSAKHYGISKLLMKPITITDLAWAVHEILNDSQ